MSYCRFGYRSDVYCYEADWAWMIHVAKKRWVSDEPFPEWPTDITRVPIQELMAAYQAERDWYKGARLEPIGLPLDGQDHAAADQEEALAWLIRLRDMGYQVPQGAIDRLREEVDEPPTEAD